MLNHRPRMIACGWLATVALVASLAWDKTGWAQAPARSPFEAALSTPESPPELPDGPPSLSNAELLERLQRAEARLQGLEAAHEENAGIVSALQNRWSQVRDPSIETVEQQTHGSSTKDRRVSK